MTFAKRVFTLAGALGLLAVFPLFFLEGTLARVRPPAFSHPELFYGFVGIVSAWQVAFLVIGRDPARFRPLMIPSILEKAGFGLPAVALFAAGRVPAPVLALGLFDLTLGALFAIAFARTSAPKLPQG